VILDFLLGIESADSKPSKLEVLDAFLEF